MNDQFCLWREVLGVTASGASGAGAWALLASVSARQGWNAALCAYGGVLLTVLAVWFLGLANGTVIGDEEEE